jgi:O-antigen/teichoic acid export membrane protein
MALPGLVATISFSDHLIGLLFSKDFLPATEIMPYLAIASLIKFISWPLAYIPLVTGQSRTYAAIEFTLHLSGLVFCLAGVSYLGFFGIGVAMLAQNIIGLLASVLVTTKSTGYVWPLRITLLAFFSVSVAVAVSTVKELLPTTTAIVVNTLITLALASGSGFYLRRAASAAADDGPM